MTAGRLHRHSNPALQRKIHISGQPSLFITPKTLPPKHKFYLNKFHCVPNVQTVPLVLAVPERIPINTIGTEIFHFSLKQRNQEIPNGRNSFERVETHTFLRDSV
jgi:hypothetical protein